MRLVYRKKMLENRYFLIGIFQHFPTVADMAFTKKQIITCNASLKDF